ncbi:unnamed protein product [Acidithrix sp. C25]|nr:unnamed protein product [Acidithrix sp. C25]
MAESLQQLGWILLHQPVLLGQLNVAGNIGDLNSYSHFSIGSELIDIVIVDP